MLMYLHGSKHKEKVIKRMNEILRDAMLKDLKNHQ
jgi:hypothetical protein